MKRAACGLLLLVLCACSQDQGLQISGAWIPEAPPGAGVMAGYFVAKNASRAACTLDGASSADFGQIEIHRTIDDNGRMRMLHGQSAPLGPGEQVRFEAGGLHLMLFRTQKELREGDTATITVTCGALSAAVPFAVRKNP